MSPAPTGGSRRVLRTQVVAHRGHSAAAPENSLEALRLAVAAGADLVECDVRLAADGIPVVSHDADLQRLAGRSIRIADTPAAVLEAVANDAGASVLPLTRLMAAALGRLPLMLDVKSTDPLVLETIAQAAREARFREEDIVLGLRVPELVEPARAFLPNAVVLALHGPSAPAGAFLAAGVRLVRLWEAATDRDAVRGLTDQGAVVWVTTGGPGTGRAVGDVTEEALSGLLQTGIAGVLVNDPDLARTVRARDVPAPRVA